jgi:hypothetical protein
LPIATIIEIVISTKEIKEKMHTPCRSSWSQPLLDNEDLDEELVDDEQKKERRTNHKEWSDGYWWSVFCQKCHNEGHLTKECKLL